MATFVPSPPAQPPPYILPWEDLILMPSLLGLLGLCLIWCIWKNCKPTIFAEIEVDPDTNLPVRKYVAHTGNPMIDLFAGGPAQPTPELMNTLAAKADREDEEARQIAEKALNAQTGEGAKEEEEDKGKKKGKKEKRSSKDLNDPQQAV